MATHDFTVFFPLNVRSSGYLYGWELSKYSVCIAGVIPCTSLHDAQILLSHVQRRQSSSVYHSQTVILGKCAFMNENLSLSNLIIDIIQFNRFKLILFQPPNRNRMQFLSHSPFALDAFNSISPSIDLKERYYKLHKANFLERKEEEWGKANIPLEYMNVVHELSTLVEEIIARTQSGSSHETEKEICLNVPGGILGFEFPPKLLSFLIKLRIKDVSDCAYQLEERFQQLFSLPYLFRFSPADKDRDIARRSILHLNLKNCLWLIINDSIFGIHLSIFLWQNSEILSVLLHRYTKWLTIDLVQNVLVWLDNWPAGLKLNTELSRFLYICFMTFTEAWKNVLEFCAPLFPCLFKAAAVAGCFGMTMTLCLLSDIFNLFTIHFYISYLISTALFANQLSIAHSLWNLFRGKRYNALRNRIDSTNYDIDQLLVGTILLTLVAFTLPTIIVYYSLFALIRFGIILVHAAVEAVVASLNHFPLFTIMLRLREPACLPGGVYFENGRNIPGSLILRNRPIPLSHIFFQHILLWSRLSTHYHPVRLVNRLVRGRPLTQISRRDIRYITAQQTLQ